MLASPSSPDLGGGSTRFFVPSHATKKLAKIGAASSPQDDRWLISSGNTVIGWRSSGPQAHAVLSNSASISPVRLVAGEAKGALAVDISPPPASASSPPRAAPLSLRAYQQMALSQGLPPSSSEMTAAAADTQGDAEKAEEEKAEAEAKLTLARRTIESLEAHIAVLGLRLQEGSRKEQRQAELWNRVKDKLQLADGGEENNKGVRLSDDDALSLLEELLRDRAVLKQRLAEERRANNKLKEEVALMAASPVSAAPAAVVTKKSERASSMPRSAPPPPPPPPAPPSSMSQRQASPAPLLLTSRSTATSDPTSARGASSEVEGETAEDAQEPNAGDKSTAAPSVEVQEAAAPSSPVPSLAKPDAAVAPFPAPPSPSSASVSSRNRAASNASSTTMTAAAALEAQSLSEIYTRVLRQSLLPQSSGGAAAAALTSTTPVKEEQQQQEASPARRASGFSSSSSLASLLMTAASPSSATTPERRDKDGQQHRPSTRMSLSALAGFGASTPSPLARGSSLKDLTKAAVATTTSSPLPTSASAPMFSGVLGAALAASEDEEEDE